MLVNSRPTEAFAQRCIPRARVEIAHSGIRRNLSDDAAWVRCAVFSASVDVFCPGSGRCVVRESGRLCKLVAGERHCSGADSLCVIRCVCVTDRIVIAVHFFLKGAHIPIDAQAPLGRCIIGDMTHRHFNDRRYPVVYIQLNTVHALA